MRERKINKQKRKPSGKVFSKNPDPRLNKPTLDDHEWIFTQLCHGGWERLTNLFELLRLDADGGVDMFTSGKLELILLQVAKFDKIRIHVTNLTRFSSILVARFWPIFVSTGIIHLINLFNSVLINLIIFLNYLNHI